jgi:hypothetical protein
LNTDFVILLMQEELVENISNWERKGPKLFSPFDCHCASNTSVMLFNLKGLLEVSCSLTVFL